MKNMKINYKNWSIRIKMYLFKPRYEKLQNQFSMIFLRVENQFMCAFTDRQSCLQKRKIRDTSDVSKK